jgi:LPXTG-motif cell wall-anchored protein
MIAVGALALTLAASPIGHVAAAEATVGLGTANSFAVVGGSTVTNTGPSVISGDLGVSPGSAVTGFPPGTVIDGVIHAADAEAGQAQAAVVTAYNDAAGRATTATITADLGGQTLVSGVYTGGSVGLTGTLTLDAQDDPNAVFIFQASSTLLVAGSSQVSLINGAQACNVFWQVGSSATIGTGAAFAGNVLALTSVTAQTGATVSGRLFARNGAVTLDTNTITRPGCTIAPIATTTTTTEVASTTTEMAPTTTEAGGGPTTDTDTPTTTDSGGSTTVAPGTAPATTPTTPPASTPLTIPATGSTATNQAVFAASLLLLGGAALFGARRSVRR